VEGVDDVEVPDIGRGGLVGHVDGVPEREVPDREGLELGVARVDAPAVVVVELGEAGGELAAAGPRARDDDQGLFRLDVVVGPVALVAHDEVHVGGVALREAVGVDPDVAPLELVLELPGRGLVLEAGDHDPQDADAPVAQVVDELQGVGVVGDPEIGPDLLALDVSREDAQQQVHLVLEVLQQPELDVGVVAGQDPGGVVVVQELPPELEVEAVAGPGDPLQDLRRLLLDILFVVEPHLAGHCRSPSGYGIVTAGTLTRFGPFVKPFADLRSGPAAAPGLPGGERIPDFRSFFLTCPRRADNSQKRPPRMDRPASCFCRFCLRAQVSALCRGGTRPAFRALSERWVFFVSRRCTGFLQPVITASLAGRRGV